MGLDSNSVTKPSRATPAATHNAPDTRGLLLGRQALCPHAQPRFVEAAPRAPKQELARQAAGDVDEHGPGDQPGQDRIEVDAGVHQHQQRAGPGPVFVQAQQLGGLAGTGQLALAQRIGQRPQDQQRARDPEPAADPHRIEQVQGRVAQQRGRRKRQQRQVERQHLAAEQAGLHGTHARCLTGLAPRPIAARRRTAGTGPWRCRGRVGRRS